MTGAQLRQVANWLLEDANMRIRAAQGRKGSDDPNMQAAIKQMEAEARDRKKAAFELQDYSAAFKDNEQVSEPLRAAARTVAQSFTFRTDYRDQDGNVLVSIRADVIDALRRQVAVLDKELKG